MKLLLELKVPGHACGWRLEKVSQRYVLSANAAQYRFKLREMAKEILGIKNIKKHKSKLSREDEFAVVMHIHSDYDGRFYTDGQRITDLDHIGTLVMNAFEDIIYRDDVQVSSLQQHRWPENGDGEWALVKVYSVEKE